MASKFYAVRRGRQTGIFNSWEECKAQIDGYSGAEYKSFKTAAEAMDYVLGVQVQKSANTGAVSGGERKNIGEKAAVSDGKAVAYVDGSYNIATKEYSYGAIFIYQGEEYEFSEKGEDASLSDMRNVAGEILGARKMMELSVEKGIAELDLYYDYEGIEKWCNGAWQAKKPGTMQYRDAYNSMKTKLKVNFHKVAAHTGVELNERVDILAKKALGMA